jgi:hypothetical protein
MAKSKDEGVRVTPEMYPNGATYFKVWLDGEPVGSFEAKDGGYVLWACRKPWPTIVHAAREVIWKRVRESIARANRFSQAMNLPVNADAVDPVAANSHELTTRV